MKRIVFTLVIGCALASAGAASAESRKPFEFRLGAAAGGTPWLGGVAPNIPSTAKFTAVGTARFRAPRYTPVGIELSVVPAHGFGANMLFDVLQIGRFRWHLVDLGVFHGTWRPVTVERIPRNWDMTFGTGFETAVWRGLSLTLDWRVFMPDPMSVLIDYGDFARLIYAEALKGGQTWFGASWSW